MLVLLFCPQLPALTALGLSLFCGGSISNLLDRIALGGNVVDFLNFSWGGFQPYIFNVADAAIVAGAALVLAGGAWALGRRAFRAKREG